MAEIDTHSKVTTPRLGPAPARIGMVPVRRVADQAASEAKVPRPLPWVARRLATWVGGSIFFAFAFHLTGFVLVGVIAIVFPIAYWVYFIFKAQSYWGPSDGKYMRAEVSDRMQHDTGYVYRLGSPEREFLDRRLLDI